MKHLTAALLAVFCLLMCALAPAMAGYEPLFAKAKAASWAVYVRAPGGMSAICSATAYRSDAGGTHLLTAGHCFAGTDSKTDFLVTQDHFTFVAAKLEASGLHLKSGASANSTDLSDYYGDDFALIVARVPNKPTLPIGHSHALVLGEDLLMVGVPLGVDFLAVQGIVGSTDMSLSTLIWNHYYGANIYTAAGNSGSGIIDTKQGAIVGVLVAAPGTQSTQAVFTPIDTIFPR